jgi:YbbR domain-containing protein
MKSKVLTALLAFGIAFGLWLYVITVERTQIEYTFYNVPVVLDGESVLEDRGLMITSDTDRTVNLTLSGNRSDLNKLKSSDITVLVDLTRIYEAGEKNLSYAVSFPGNVQDNAIEIVSRQPDTISLTVAQWATKEIPVQIAVTGTPAPGYKVDDANKSANPKSVAISGPKELIDQIAMGKVMVSMTDAKESYEQRQKLTLCDAQGNPVDEDLSNVFVENHMILVKIPVLMEKEISLRRPEIIPGGGLTEDEVKLTMSFDKITVTGSPAVVSKMADVIELDRIYLATITESYTNQIRFTLPEGVKSQQGNVVEVSLTLPNRDFRNMEIPVTQFEAINVPNGYEASFSAHSMDVTLRGKSASLSRLEATDIRVIVDLAGATERGYYPAQILVESTQGVGAVEDPNDPYQVYVLITPAEQGA